MQGSREPNNRLTEGEFLKLFLKHEQVLRAYARAILPDWSSVEDALQEASVTAVEDLDENGEMPVRAVGCVLNGRRTPTYATVDPRSG